MRKKHLNILDECQFIRNKSAKASAIFDRVFNKMDDFYLSKRVKTEVFTDKVGVKIDYGYSIKGKTRGSIIILYLFDWKDYPEEWKRYSKALNKIDKISKYWRGKRRLVEIHGDDDFLSIFNKSTISATYCYRESLK